MTRNLQILKYLFCKTKIRKVSLNNDFQDSFFKKIKLGRKRVIHFCRFDYVTECCRGAQVAKCIPRVQTKGPNKADTKKNHSRKVLNFCV